MATKAKSKSKAASATRARPASKPSAQQTTSSSLRLNPPKHLTFWAAVVVAVLGVLAYILHFTALLSFTWLPLAAFVLMVIAFALLLLGLLVKGF